MGENTQRKSVIIGSLIFLFCCTTLGQCVLFLSSHNNLKYPLLREVSTKESTNHRGIKFLSLLWDVGLLLTFVLQHTLQANENFKAFLKKKQFDVYERLLYNCGSCLVLQLLMYFWKPLSYPTIWSVSTHDNPLMWWVFTIVHIIAWLTIYSGCFIMDISELLGIKQVYHRISNWPHPFCQKSEGLLRFYSHMRHPGFSALVLILFCHPVMLLDRWLLANGLTLYMVLGYKVDDIDYAYQKRMFDRKSRSLTSDK